MHSSDLQIRVEIPHKSLTAAGQERTDSRLIEDGLGHGQSARVLGVQLALVGGHAAVEGLAVCTLGHVGCTPALGLRHPLPK
jgi:hypothetical protein